MISRNLHLFIVVCVVPQAGLTISLQETVWVQDLPSKKCWVCQSVMQKAVAQPLIGSSHAFADAR